MSYTELKREVFEANMELNRRNLVVYTWGNVSQIDRSKGVIAIKPSGVAYEVMTPDDIVIVDLENQIVEDSPHKKSMRPSSDTKTHTHLYRHFDAIGGDRISITSEIIETSVIAATRGSTSRVNEE